MRARRALGAAAGVAWVFVWLGCSFAGRARQQPKPLPVTLKPVQSWTLDRPVGQVTALLAGSLVIWGDEGFIAARPVVRDTHSEPGDVWDFPGPGRSALPLQRAVARGAVFIVTTSEQRLEPRVRIHALDAATGRQRWTLPIFEGLGSPPVGGIPVVVGNGVYVLVQQRGKPAWRLWRFDAQKGTPSDSADIPDLNGIAWPPVPVLIGGQLRLAVLAVPVYAPACHIFSSDEPLRLVGRRGVPAWSPEDAQRFAIVGSDLYLSEFPDTRIEGGPSLFRISLDLENRVVWRVPNCSPDKVLADADGVYIPVGDQVVCLEPADGAVRWRVPGQLLAISEGVVLAAANPAPKATTADILALDPKTGKTVWRARPSAGLPTRVATDGKWLVCVSQDERRRQAVFDVFGMPKRHRAQ